LHVIISFETSLDLLVGLRVLPSDRFDFRIAK
jgi:hypothetical protein